MTVTESAPKKTKRSREYWDDTYERVARDFPASQGDEHEIAWPKEIPLAGLMRLVGDIGTVGVTWGGVGGGRGGRGGHARREHEPALLAETIQTVFREGVGVGQGTYDPSDWTNDPFVEAFKRLQGDRTLMQLSRRTEIPKHRLQRLLTGKHPTKLEMEAIARTFSKPPWYFREYRAKLITALVFEHMDQNPERTGAMVVASLVLEHMDQNPDWAIARAQELELA